MNTQLRRDLALIAEWIPHGAKVLDLGCGDGALLAHLTAEKQVTGYGLEINAKNVTRCVAQGVNVLQYDLNKSLSHFQDASFDVVVMSSAIQQMDRPDQLVREMLRIGKQSIVTFPNFGHWRPRFSLGIKGLMPMSKALPNPWYATPNIHLCTVKDFNRLCREQQLQILNRRILTNRYQTSLATRLLPNIFGEVALYRLQVQP